MKPLAELLRHLARPGVTELTLATGRPPMIRGSNGFEPLEPGAVTLDDVTRALQAMVGLARAATVTETPVLWSVNATGLGTLSIAAMRRGDLMHLRLTRASEGAPAAPGGAGAPGSAGGAAAALASAAGAVPSAAPPTAAAAGASPAYASQAASPSAPPGASGPAHASPGGAAASSSYYGSPGGAAASGSAPGSPSGAAASGPAYGSPNGAAASGPGYGPPGGSAASGSPYASPGGAAASGPAHSAAAPAATARTPVPSPGAPGASEPAARMSSGGAAAAPTPVFRPSPRPSVGASRGLAALLEEGRREGASDVHVVAGRPVLFRLAGDLVPQGDVLDAQVVERLLLPWVPERLKPVLEKDGSCDFSLESPEMGRFRVNVGRHRTGLKGTFRVIAREVPTLESLGLPVDIAKAVHHHQGLIVLTGPSGHGKTSTLAALVDIINRETTHHVLTVEDPVEFVHPRKRALISQREVGTHTKTFASALKGSLREDPDVIVVGELRDTETVRMALAASETGHLLISTMNTPSAAKTIDRLIDLFPPADQQQVRLSLATGLRLIVSQRLLPGADGRSLVAAAEVLPGSVGLGNLIRDNKTFQIPSLQQRGKSLGIIRFEDSLVEVVKAGKVKLEVAKGFADNPDELEAMVTGKRPGATTVSAPETSQESARLLGKMGSLMGRKGA